MNVPCLSDLLGDVLSAHVQVERKRHIGNDIVTIVFQEGEEPSPAFKPSMIRSHFTRILGLGERASVASDGSASPHSKPPSKHTSSLTCTLELSCVARFLNAFLSPRWGFFSLSLVPSLSVHSSNGWIHSQRILDF